ncbi:EF-hand domain-containing protein, partial [Wenyingzhuangia sp. 1_MG-2023]|nr:EF-hand domain-containing protein [Wenyingzhuangia sp. 1_MG-2023]
ALPLLVLSAYSLTAVAADDDRPQRPPSFEQMDTNGDNELSKDEVKGPLLDDFDKFDEDGSGTLTEDELPEPPKGR